MKETISITAEDGTVYEFEKPEFGCEFWKIGSINNLQYSIIGSVEMYGCTNLVYWNFDGKCHQGNGYFINEWNLTQIKKEWYEDETNFPALLIKNYGTEEKPDYDYGLIMNASSYIVQVEENGWRLATKEEVESLYYEGK